MSPDISERAFGEAIECASPPRRVAAWRDVSPALFSRYLDGLGFAGWRG
jgi:hypothetical protein